MPCHVTVADRGGQGFNFDYSGSGENNRSCFSGLLSVMLLIIITRAREEEVPLLAIVLKNMHVVNRFTARL
jgi:hypothetical protein